MINFVKSGKSVTCTAPSGGVTSGTPVLIGGLLGVPYISAAAGVDFDMDVIGEFTMPKDGNAISVGAVYWDNTNMVITATATSNTKVGFAPKAALAGDATVRVHLNGTV